MKTAILLVLLFLSNLGASLWCAAQGRYDLLWLLVDAALGLYALIYLLHVRSHPRQTS